MGNAVFGEGNIEELC